MNQLAQLVEITTPDAISWWPLAPGWYLVVFVFFITALFVAWHKRKTWLRNQYRRNAIFETQKLTYVEANQLNQLLRLAAQRGSLEWRNKRAQLNVTGKPWFELLNSLGPKDLFTQEQVARLEYLNYHSSQESAKADVLAAEGVAADSSTAVEPKQASKLNELSETEFELLKTLAIKWLKEHKFEHLA
ncbi:DUF4381 domain-containing protein [Shewanella pneumatophori]|uniref:DUF4381 domain-containing protein n=1 Tax=Shewanella pneumatophori TaxID=314092 RepID=A0A9X1ZFR1_9GAMM|nr:DUF4381 domain-containing protein [Shewanella pneumatophori]MCL1140187.1 DUF4381 domain-containing protein [Shewanella pneumatophori]